jgi:hypothetical protein
VDALLTPALPMNLVAADVSPLHLLGREIRADSRRLLRFRGSMREPVRGILSSIEEERERGRVTA